MKRLRAQQTYQVTDLITAANKQRNRIEALEAALREIAGMADYSADAANIARAALTPEKTK
jgi:hypothetical protein